MELMPTVKQEITDLLQYDRFNRIEITEVQILDRATIPESWTHILKNITDEAYSVCYSYVKRVAPWDRQEVGLRRAWVARLLQGPRGAMGLLSDVETGPTHIEVDPIHEELPDELSEHPF
jgi:hypothetical protein